MLSYTICLKDFKLEYNFGYFVTNDKNRLCKFYGTPNIIKSNKATLLLNPHDTLPKQTFIEIYHMHVFSSIFCHLSYLSNKKFDGRKNYQLKFFEKQFDAEQKIAHLITHSISNDR